MINFSLRLRHGRRWHRRPACAPFFAILHSPRWVFFCVLWCVSLSTSIALASTPPTPIIKPPPPAAPIPAAPTPASPSSDAYAALPIPDLNARLAALKPTNPVDYFRLAEEVAEEREADGARGLARRLYILAFELDRQSEPPTGLAASACLGLAALTTIQSEKRWLRALASQYEPPRPSEDHPGAALRIDPPAVPERAALQVASALGAVRGGEGARANAMLRRPGLWPVIEANETMLPGGISRLRELISTWPSCPECHNRRLIIKPLAPGGPPSPRLCPTCGGMPGPVLPPAELLGQLRLEAALLRGIHRLWSAQIQADGGEPLRDPRAEDVALIFRVDANAVLYRNGKWVPEPKKP